jgi:hypothetical protein
MLSPIVANIKEREMGVPNLNLIEIKPGLVMFLSHAELERRGYRVRGQRSDRKGHHFLCLNYDDNSTWVMLTSQRGYGYGRTLIAPNDKAGDPRWVEAVTYVSGADALLRIHNWDLQAATCDDKSRQPRRNWVSEQMTDRLYESLVCQPSAFSAWGI